MTHRIALAALPLLLTLSACGTPDRRPPGPRQCTVHLIAGSTDHETVKGELVQADESWVIVKTGEDTYTWIPKENAAKVELEPAPPGQG